MKRFNSTDVRDEASVKKAREQTEEILGDNGLNVLINNAAVYTKNPSIQTVSVEEMASAYLCNVIGPAIMSRVSI